MPGKIFNIDPPSTSKLHHYFIASDWHAEFLHKASFKALLRAADLAPKTRRYLIILGDFLDCDYLFKGDEMHKIYRKTMNGMDDFFVPKIKAECQWANEILDHLEKHFEKIYFVEGNHDWRLEEAHDSWVPPEYRHYFHLESLLHLRKRGMPHIPYNDWIQLGPKLMLTHGMYASKASALKLHYEASGGHNVIFGHVHRYEVKSFTTINETRQAISLPAMCTIDPAPKYLKGRPHNWSNGFMSLMLKQNGNFNYNIHQIWDGELSLLGQKLWDDL